MQTFYCDGLTRLGPSLCVKKPVFHNRPVHLHGCRPSDFFAFFAGPGFISNGDFFDFQAFFQEFDCDFGFKREILRGDGDPFKCFTGKNFITGIDVRDAVGP
jgi:hypothetical protein